jgi:hypothetical protein
MHNIIKVLKRVVCPGGFVFALLLMPALCFAQVYQWVDEDGNVHFGDQPPADAGAQSVNLPKGPSDQQVEAAQQELQNALDARESESAAAIESAPEPTAQRSGQSIPEFGCYTPIEQVLSGPVRAAYEPLFVQELNGAQQSGVRTILASAGGSWRGSSVELVCSGNIDAARSEKLNFSVRSTGTWRSGDSRLILENRARGSRRRVNETRVSFFEVGDVLYFREANGDGQLTTSRTLALRGNKAEGFFLDDVGFAFMNRSRSFNVVRTELRHLQVKGNRLDYTELYFHQNLLTGSRVWSLSR